LDTAGLRLSSVPAGRPARAFVRLCPLEVRAAEERIHGGGAVAKPPLDVELAEDRALKIRAAELRALQVGAGEPRVPQVGITEVRVLQVGAAEPEVVPLAVELRRRSNA
jgi:hypothetical protein